MGLFRLLLAALVVLFHFGGLSWVVGRVAVFAFYAISGFLIFQVLDRVYLRESLAVGRFLANRFVRLAPLYVACALLTVGVLTVHPRLSAALATAGVNVTGGSPVDLLWNTVVLRPFVSMREYLPVLAFQAPLLPQGWSIGIEASFYLLAPVVVLATRRRPLWSLAWIAAGLALLLYGFHVAGADFGRFQDDVYKNAVTSVVVFFAGGSCYYAKRRWGYCVAPSVAWLAVALWLAFLNLPTLADTSDVPRSAALFAQHLWLTLVVTGLVLLSAPPRWSWLDRAAGNLAYGVYLNHFIVAAVLLSLRPPGSVSTDALGFGALVLAGSCVLAAITYAAIERPFDAVRAQVRGSEAPRSAQPDVRPHLPWAVVSALVLAGVSSPVAGAVMRINGTIPELPLSGQFDIRWSADTSERERQRIEAEFALVMVGPVERDPRHRTYEYRLPNPTRARVRALITRAAVEDTARIDTSRYAIAP